MLILVFVLLYADIAPTQVFDEPVSISSVYDVAGLPTLMSVVYAIDVFVIEKLDARLSKLEVAKIGIAERIIITEIDGLAKRKMRVSRVR